MRFFINNFNKAFTMQKADNLMVIGFFMRS